MLYATAVQWVQAMNSAKYLGSSAWQIPATSATLLDLYNELNMSAGDSRIQWVGSTGPFQNLQPSFYWACGRDQSGTSQSPCVNYSPADGTIQLQWSYDFDYGFQSTSALVQRYFVMVYYPATTASGPEITLAGATAWRRRRRRRWLGATYGGSGSSEHDTTRAIHGRLQCTSIRSASKPRELG